MRLLEFGLLGRLRIARKLNVLLVLAIVAIAAVAAFALHSERRVMMEDRITSTRNLVETAHSIVVSLHERAARGELSDDDARNSAIAAIKALRYAGENYFWINDMQPRMVMHPIKPEMNGTDLSNFTDPNGVKLFRQAVDKVRADGAGFIEYAWPRPGAQAPVPKISFVKGFAPWNWVIGSGIYVDDIDTAIKSETITLGMIAGIVTLLLGLLSHLIARAIVGPLNRAVTFAKDIANGDMDSWIEAPAARDESADLTRALGTMQTKLKQQIESLETVVSENAIVCEALNNLDTKVRIADYDGKVLFANRALLQLLKELEPDVQTFRPSFSAEKFVGGNIGDIYPDSAAAVGRMRNVTKTLRARAPNYGRVIDFVYTPMIGADGRQRGTIAEWIDVTAQVTVENQLLALVEQAGHGDFSSRIDLAGKDGVILNLAKGINQLLNVIEHTLGEVGRVLGAMSTGDLRESITGEFDGMLAKLRDDANKTVRELCGMVRSIQLATDGINNVASEIAGGNEDLSARAAQQTESLQVTAASMDQLTNTVRQNADSARDGNKLALDASGIAQKGNAVVAAVVETMNAISDSSRRISDIIGVIDSIAFQTNILALNAAVEAARAGEQGRGFAVVASEVRNLAQRSAEAAKEIKSLIGASVERVGVGATLVHQAGDTMKEVVTSIKRVSDIMGEISAASQEQSTSIVRVNTTVAAMDDSTQETASLVEEASASAAGLADQVLALGAAVSRFKLPSSEKNAENNVVTMDAKRRAAGSRATV